MGTKMRAVVQGAPELQPRNNRAWHAAGTITLHRRKNGDYPYDNQINPDDIRNYVWKYNDYDTNNNTDYTGDEPANCRYY